ncbi:MAG: dihydrofolate reductase family protein [Actinomycetota bacterium]|nr:dihydrofolate reductase family protein [Actinomycetota bacterium]
MMVTTLDGAATGPDGLSGSISSAGDQQVFAETRRLADVVLVGAGTVRTERYQPLRAEPAALDERLSIGLAVAPRLVIVSASLQLPWTDPVFGESAVRPLIFTVGDCDTTALAVARKHAEVTVLPGSQVDPVAVLDHLTSLGLFRVVCEGGPRLLADLAKANVVDEADISIAPLIVGGGQKVTGSAMLKPNRFMLVHSIVDDGYLFNRYVTS